MVAFVEGQIQFLAKQLEAFPRGGEVADLKARVDEAVALSLLLYKYVYAEAERICPADSWSEANARAAVPPFQTWYGMAQKTLALLRDVKRLGVVATDEARFMAAFLEAKSIAMDFETDLQILRRIDRGESRSRRLEGSADELRHRA